MGSLAAEIARLVDPTPEIADPEDEVNIESVAKLSAKYKEEGEDNDQISRLRSRNAPRLEEIDSRYAGKRISRKLYDEPLAQSNSDDDEGETDDEEDNDDEDDLKVFKQQMNKKEVEENQNISEMGNDEEVEDEQLDDERDESGYGDNSEDEENEEDESDEEDEQEEEGIDIIQKFSEIDVNKELEKGKAVQKQIELWNKLCECRIKLQKLLVAANRLPQHGKWDEFIAKSDKTYSENISKGHKSIGNLLNGLLEVQEQLLNSDPDYSGSGRGTDNKKSNDNASDEEIPSDSEEENVNNECDNSRKRSNDTPKVNRRKRKFKYEEFEEVLAKRHKSLVPYRNVIIQKWDDKTRLSTGRMTQKSFNAFEQSPLKQIDQILQDKIRLLKRTQLKRSTYTILGKEEIVRPVTEDETAENSTVGVDHSKDYDPEIFDDDDFYRQILRDIIESKSIGMDPLVLSKQLEIHRLRRKMKRKVDTKASKGRKLRFSVHPKLVNFLASIMTYTMSEDAQNELFKSIFGQRHAPNE